MQQLEQRQSACLEVEWDRGPGVRVVTLRGEAGFRQSPRLGEALARVSARRPGFVLLDLAGLTFISSLAMGELVRFQRALARYGGRVVLVAVPPSIAGALRRARLDAVLDIRGASPEAV